MSPEILTLIWIRTTRCYVLRYFVVVDDHLHFIRKIGWIGNFGPVNNFHVRSFLPIPRYGSKLDFHPSFFPLAYFIEHCLQVDR